MYESLAPYLYLLVSVFYSLAIVLLSLVTLPRPGARLTLLSGVIAIPGALLTIFFEGNYWNPTRLGGLSIGIEDVATNFAAGALAWYGVALVTGSRLRVFGTRGESIRRFVILSSVCLAPFLVGIWLGLDAMSAWLVTCAITVPLLWLRRPWMLRLTAIGVPAFTLMWYAAARLPLWLFPEAARGWSTEVPWGSQVAGVPVGELVYAVSFGALWPLFTATVCDTRRLTSGETATIQSPERRS
ncbi:MAG TPA: hypothetical protein VI383_11610 [Gemmatimonadales bacterium]|nr:hypothetical protein [Gemmatimonadales bacterium]